MPSSAAPLPAHLVASASLFASADTLLPDLLAVSLTAIKLLRPIYGSGGDIQDFTLEYLNPAAQRMTGLPERPGGTIGSHFPNVRTNGVFDLYQRVFETGEPGQHELSDQADGSGNYFHVAARRSGDLLVVSFTDTAAHPRTAVELALRDSQSRERQALTDAEALVQVRTQALETARAETDAQRHSLQALIAEAPALIARLRGPNHFVELANERFRQLLGGREMTGRPYRDALPELTNQAFFDQLDAVYRTGETYYGTEIPADLDRHNSGELTTAYFDYTYQATRDAQGRIDGILLFANDVSEQVEARQERAVQQQQLGDAFEQAPVAICVFRGPDYVLDVVNASMGEMLGYPPAWLKGKPFFAALPELVDQGLRTLLDGVRASGKAFVAQAQPIQLAQHLPDETGFYDFVYQPLRDANGNIGAITCIATDVTEQVRARRQVERLNQELADTNEELQCSNEELRANNDELAHSQQAVLEEAQRRVSERETFYQVFEQTPACIALLREPEHRFEYVNAAYQQLFPTRRLVGRSLAEALPETVKQGFVALLDNVYRTGETYFGQDLPLRLEQPDGSTQDVYFTFTYQAYRENGAIAGISIFAHDVTAQVRARQEREAQQNQLHTLFMQAPAPIVILDGSELVFQLVNPAYQLIFPGRELLNKPLLEALPELQGTPIPDLLRQVFETGATYTAQELPLMLARHEGAPLEEIYWTFIYQARRNAYGTIDGILAFAHEVTDQVQARRVVEASGEQARMLAEELRETNTQLTRTNVDLDNFIYTASHDLKAPISNIEGLLHALRTELPPQPPGGEVSYIMELMQDSVNRFTRTIEHLTDVSKLQKEHGQPSATVPLAAVIEDVRLDLAPLLKQTGGLLDVDVRATPLVTFSEKNLRSVVYNLLSNAFKYQAPERPARVRIRSRTDGDYHVIDVQDNGLGLDLARDQYLFTMFRRYHTHVEGSGVGLFMVKKMLENVGGKIEVASKLGYGSTFSVYIPR
ncbi:PAS domain-containing protein [Hymenobacter sp. BT683]|uniref:histidine kinase n=1 Tax=Hymenobacter jeongseonensis TaxID=2791027 RepID=A0ABS0ILU8_9BACT|nr:PAS domain-containing protein [Hymenobacter jeongseonensis]MBF9239340.1 PAS domain-containing protein [Hymenobacter jeongseonensis]